MARLTPQRMPYTRTSERLRYALSAAFSESLWSQRQHPLEARDVSALLGLFVLGQARQQRFGGGNTLSISSFPGVKVRGGFEPFSFFAV